MLCLGGIQMLSWLRCGIGGGRVSRIDRSSPGAVWGEAAHIGFEFR